MSMNVPTGDERTIGDTYAQWVRRAIRKAAQLPGRQYNLFSSSVPEPLHLVQQLILEGFSDPITDSYKSVFVSGNPVLLDHLSHQYQVGRRQVLCTTGATGGMAMIYRAHLKAGDHILVERPGFDLFANLAQQQSVAVDYFWRTGDGFSLDVNAIAALVQPNTRMIVLSNLHNPSSALIDESTLRTLAALADKHDLLVAVDEVYSDYARVPGHFTPAAQISDRFFSVSSLTKNYGLDTLRCGWIVASEKALDPVRELNDQFEFGVSKLSHAVAAMVMENRRLFDDYWITIFGRARPVMDYYMQRWLQAGLVEGQLPEFGCITFIRLVGIDDTILFTDWLAERHGVFVVPGEYFGAPGYVRIGFGLDADELDKSLARFEAGVREYRTRHTPAVAVR
ncbi:MAG: pyridoxal phosphate-dependent aminotransferase [Alphaproteobacteria bacterium]|nr:MAG: pyridoxal phosphate-dependent aminotransferase [Alphaproteobacteria bacterium]